MPNKATSDQPKQSAIKDPQEWVTGDEPMTGAQQSYLNTLAREAGEQPPPELTKAEASEAIEQLQAATGRGPSEPTGRPRRRQKR